MNCRPGITLTGLDERSQDLGDEILATYPQAELGILFSLSRVVNGLGPRYPTQFQVHRYVERWGHRCAVHLCGSDTKEAFLRHQFPWIEEAGRIQWNGSIDLPRLAAIYSEFLQPNPHLRLITQFPKNPLLHLLDLPQHEVLVDASGGLGKRPETWSPPHPDPALRKIRKPTGYAGGLGPDNLQEQLLKMFEGRLFFFDQQWWVDMESGLRDAEDWLVPEKCHQVCQIHQDFTRDVVQPL